MKSSLVQQNIGGLEHWVCEEADAAFVLRIALDLSGRKKNYGSDFVSSLAAKSRFHFYESSALKQTLLG